MSGERAGKRYTVKQLAVLSGVSVRTLHHYDALGLLKPAMLGDNRYRYYGRAELLRLQQILFHRELGLSLERIREVLDAPNFDRASALRDQRAFLLRETERLRQLVRTIDDTLRELEGGKAVEDKSLYRGFSAQADAWAIERYGDAARWGIETRDKVTQNWSEADWDRFHEDAASVLREFAAARSQGHAADGAVAQALARRFHATASKAWIEPINRGGMTNMAEIYADSPDIKAGLGRLDTGLAEYVARALRAFAAAAELWPDEGESAEGSS